MDLAGSLRQPRVIEMDPLGASLSPPKNTQKLLAKTRVFSVAVPIPEKDLFPKADGTNSAPRFKA